MEIVIVERSFAEPVPFEQVEAKEDESSWCLDIRRITLACFYFSKDRRRMICVYEAPDAESVRDANTQAELPFDRVWSATRHAAARRADR
jgi:hypothetical protein